MAMNPIQFQPGRQRYYQCRACHHQINLISDTLSAATKLPLRT